MRAATNDGHVIKEHFPCTSVEEIVEKYKYKGVHMTDARSFHCFTTGDTFSFTSPVIGAIVWEFNDILWLRCRPCPYPWPHDNPWVSLKPHKWIKRGLILAAFPDHDLSEMFYTG